MKILFNIKYSYASFALIVLAFALSSCSNDFLDRRAQGAYNQDDYPYPEGSGPYDQFINGAYATLRSYNVTVFPFLAATSMRSDDADKGSTPSDSPDALQFDNFTLTPTNGLVNALWVGHFNLVNDCNFVLDRIANDPNPNTPQALKVDAEAQARFLRGYAYFMLVRCYGRVPILDTLISTEVSESNIPQSTPAQVYAFIEQDLQFAANNLLPASGYDRKFIGRINSGAAHALLAKVYLTQGKWAQAMSEANIVMTSGQYDLSVPYATIFNEEGENSKESIFEVQATATPTVPTDFGSQYTQVQSVRGSGDWNYGWGFNVPSADLANAYEPGDPRRRRTIFYSVPDSVTIFGERPQAGLPNPRYNNKVYTNPAKRATIGSRSGWWMNVRLLRYADVVLMYAEAANELGGTENTTRALQALNSVRARARGANANILPNVTTTDQELLRQAIRKERRIELAMEHERFFDLVRWGTAATVMQGVGKNFIPGRHELLPIPQAQIDLSKGRLTQNPGYN
ncbi:RagB/SusD family nutrient uptake outer membrane protein [Pedobacter glucosidilyticus]|uniref:RagB/SusD family nutrient uptake outer membrane protein n=1 Tax=Pedobacter glucosidilyticus TaxID=1122941 RepID=UPI0004194AE6|nr:RagB/SusD family nutrient uptake outer membrane protein [Pedobacter glucosidilyticus]